MERLTSREPRASGMPGVCCTHFEGGDCQAIQGHCADGCAWEEAAWERLAAYEDTGLEPEEVTQVKLAIMGKSLAEIKGFEGVSIDRMIELAQAEKDGRLVVLPPNDPLTLEELREMDGEPVWVCEPNGTNGVWGLVDLEYQMVRLHGGGLAIWENNDKSWLAYRRKPEEGQ